MGYVSSQEGIPYKKTTTKTTKPRDGYLLTANICSWDDSPGRAASCLHDKTIIIHRCMYFGSII